MKNEIVLILMQLKGISRKTIFKSFHLEEGMPCKLENVKEILMKAALTDTRIKSYKDVEINEAIDKARGIIEKSEEADIKILTFLDSEYPFRLLEISDPPAVLYCKGNIQCLNSEKAVAIIGTRNPTEHGIKIAGNLAQSFGKREYVVVSGLAMGCDQYAHQGCLDAKGKTVAVMPCGLDTIYPVKNKLLAQSIQENGCLVSEYPIGTKVFKNQLVDRDRLQSGLSAGLVVVETDIKGGTLHTVGYAMEYGRLVGCYNHPTQFLTEKQTRGNQKLISEKKAIPIATDEELCRFRELLETKYEVKREPQNNLVQETIFDYMR